MDTKRCNQCLEIKGYDEFHKNCTMKDGRNYSCKECRSNTSEEYKRENSLRAIKWRENNLEQWRRNAKKARANYNRKHPEVHARRQISKTVREKLKKPTNVYSPTIGCSSAFLRQWMEKQFTPDMHWSNHGVVWNIDHIIPLCAFDLFIREERLYCNHYLNLRPVHIKINEKKGFKYNPEDKAELIKKIDALKQTNDEGIAISLPILKPT